MRHNINAALWSFTTALLLGVIFLPGCTATDDDTLLSGDITVDERSTLTASPLGKGTEFIGLSTRNQLVFLAATPQVVQKYAIDIQGLRGNETILAIDKAPASSGTFIGVGQGISRNSLYAVSDSGFIYTINEVSGLATRVGVRPLDPGIEGNLVGFEYDPVAQRLRVITSEGEDLRIDPLTGEVVEIGPPVMQGKAMVNAIGFAFRQGSSFASLYLLDLLGQTLLHEVSHDAGDYAEVGITGYTLSGEGGFEIVGNNAGYAVQFGYSRNNQASTLNGFDNTTEEAHRLLSVDLRTGAATSLGRTSPLIGLTAR